MKLFMWVLLLCLLPFGGITQTKSLKPLKPDCDSLFQAGERHLQGQRLELAMQCYLGALNCDSRLAGRIGPKIDTIFKGIKQQKEDAIIAKNQAEAEARRNLANDLAYKSTIALRDGDRTMAFRLAELAYRYVDENNYNVIQALIDSYYYSAGDGKAPLFWYTTIDPGPFSDGMIAYATNGKRLATTCSDYDFLFKIKIWDLGQKAIIRTLKLPYSDFSANMVGALALSPNGEQLAIGFKNKLFKILVVDVRSGKTICRMEAHSLAVTCLQFSPDGASLASGSDDGTIKYWDWQKAELKQIVCHNTNSIRAFAFSPDSKLIAANTDQYGTIAVWDLTLGDTLKTLNGLAGPVKCMAFSADGNLVAAANSVDSTICLWNVRQSIPLIRFPQSTGKINCLAFSPDSMLLACGSNDHTAAVWKISTGELLYSLPHNAELMNVFFSPDSRQLFTSCFYSVTMDQLSTVRIWELDQPKKELRLTGENVGITSRAFSADGNWIAFSLDDHNIKVLNWAGKRKSYIFKMDSAQVSNIAFSPKNDWLGAFSNDGYLTIWNWKQERFLTRFDIKLKKLEKMCFSSNGNLIAICSDNDLIQIWDWKNKKQVRELKIPGAFVEELAFSSDGKFFAAGITDGSTTVWTVHNWKLKYKFGIADEDALNPVSSIAFSPVKPELAIGYMESQIKLFDLRNGRMLRILRGNLSEDPELAYSPDGRLLATSTKEPYLNFFDVKATLNLWDTESGKLAYAIPGDFKKGLQLCFSADGRSISAITQDNRFISWLLTPDSMVASIGGNFEPAQLSWPQLQSYHLSTIFDADTENETRLKLNADAPLIEAFADLSADLNGLDILIRLGHSAMEVVNYDLEAYARAERLYKKAFANTRDSSILLKLGRLYGNWAKGYLISERADMARLYIEQAWQCNHDPFQYIKLWTDYMESIGKPVDEKYFLSSDKVEVLSACGDLYFEQDGKSQWGISRQYLEKAEAIQHSPAVLMRLHTICGSLGLSFDLNRFLSSDNPAELMLYAEYLFAEPNDRLKAKVLYEKALQKTFIAQAIVRLYMIAKESNEPFDFELFFREDKKRDLDLFAALLFDAGEDLSAPSSKQWYLDALQIRDQQLKLYPSFSLKNKVSEEYERLAEFQLAAADTLSAQASYQRAFSLSPDDPFKRAKKITLLLLRNRWPEAEKEYLYWKDRSVGPNSTQTYRKLFLDTLDQWEQKGISHPDFSKARALLRLG